MILRFHPSIATIIAQLAFGEINSCLLCITESCDIYATFLSFCDHLNKQLTNQMFHDAPNKITYEFVLSTRKALGDLLSLSFCELCETIKQPILKSTICDDLLYIYYVFAHFENIVLLIPSDKSSFMTNQSTFNDLNNISTNNTLVFQLNEYPEDLTTLCAFPHFDIAQEQADSLPAVFIWKNKDTYLYLPVPKPHRFNLLSIINDIDHVSFRLLEERYITTKDNFDFAHYIFHLSDLHFGAKKLKSSDTRLLTILETQVNSYLKQGDSATVLVTGDAVNSPNSDYETLYKQFSDQIKNIFEKPLIRLPGNHDSRYYGLVSLQHNESDTFPRIEPLDYNGEKILLLLFDSCQGGNLAQGEIGITQMQQMGNLLDKIDRANECTRIAVLHHHVAPIPTPHSYKKNIFETLFPFINEKALTLIDAQAFCEWLEQRQIHFVLHGHKHIPFITNVTGPNQGYINIISCGSSTGMISHKNKRKTFLSYNVIRIYHDKLLCLQFAEMLPGGGPKNIMTGVYDLKTGKPLALFDEYPQK